MGTNISSQTGTQIVNSYMSEINSAVASAITTVSLNTANNQSVTINVCRTAVTQGNLITNQVSTQNQTIMAASLSTVVENVKNNISAITQQFLQQTSSQEAGWLATAFNINVQDNTQVQNFSQMIANSVSSSVMTVCSDELESSQSITLNLCGYINGNIITNQSAAQNISLSCVSKQIVNFIASNSEYVQGIQQAEQQAMQTAGGLFDFLYYIAIAFVIIIFFLVIMSTISHIYRQPKQQQVPPGQRPLPPGYQQRPLPPGYQQRQLPPGYQQRRLPPGYQQRLPPGYQQRQLPPGPPGYQQLSPVYRPRPTVTPVSQSRVRRPPISIPRVPRLPPI